MLRKFLWTGLAVILTAAVPCWVGFAGAQTYGGTDASDATAAQQALVETQTSDQAATQGQDLAPQTPETAGGAARDQTLLTDPQIDRAAPPIDDGDAARQQDQARQQATTFDQAQRADEQRDLLAGVEFGQPTDAGLPVTTVGPGTIFFDSDLRPGDVIISYDGQPIRSRVDLARMIIDRPGERVPMTVLRSGREESLYVSFRAITGIRPDEYQARRPMEEPRAPMDEPRLPMESAGGPGFLGVGFDTRFFDAAVVRDVLPGTAAEQAGLRVGDVIVAINGQAISSYPEAMSVIRSMRAGDELEIDFSRRMTDSTRANLGTRPGAGPREARVVEPAYEGTHEYRYPSDEGMHDYRSAERYEAPATQMPAPAPPAQLDGERELP